MQTGGTHTELTGVNIPDDEFPNNCIHCGLCLSTCPTYSLTGLERSSPRGRIQLIKSVAEGKLPISREFIYEMNFCLLCRACETACPAGIKYGLLIEAARTITYLGGFERGIGLLFKRLLINIFSRHQRLKLLARLFRLCQTFRIQLLVDRTGILKLLPGKLSDLQFLLPRISKSFSSVTLGDQILSTRKSRYRIAFLTGCIMDVAFANVNEDTVKLLSYHGCDVIIPKGQKCCGSLQAHNGDMKTAKELARHNIELFSQYEFDYLVMNSAGCGAFMKEYFRLFAGDPEFSDKAKSISDRVRDITEFLFQTNFHTNNTGKKNVFYGKRVTYQDACHLIHAQQVSAQPRKLIQSIAGIQYIELPEASWCCGSAGIYNITHTADSMNLLKRKIEYIKQLKPDILVTGNPGCLIQLQYGLQKEGLNVELIHTATFLLRACES